MTLYADLMSKDPKRIWSSSCAIRKLRDKDQLLFLAEHLDEIRESTKDIELGGAFRSNSTHLEFSLRKIEYVKASRECICTLYLLNDQYNPVDEAAQGNVKILDTVLNSEKWIDYYRCECTLCGSKYRVEEQEYHYPWWAWYSVITE